MSATKCVDIVREDQSSPDLRAVWNALDTPVYHIVDELGELETSTIRRLSHSHWLYRDATSGDYAVLTDSEAEQLPSVVLAPDLDSSRPRLAS